MSSQKATISEFFSSLGTNYEVAYAHAPALLRFIDKSIACLPPKSRVLDLGSGTGRPVAAALDDAGMSVTGIDFSEKMIELSRLAVPRATFELADMIEYTPPAEEHFTAIFAIFALFYLNREELEQFSLNWKRWVPVNGNLFIAHMMADDYPAGVRGAIYDADGMYASGIGARFMGKDNKLGLFTVEGWRALLAERGFEIQEMSSSHFAPPADANSEPMTYWYMIARRVE